MTFPSPEEERDETKSGYRIIAYCTIALAIVGAVYFATQPEDIDQATLCPAATRILEHRVIIVDTTDPWDWNVAIRLKGQLEALRRTLPSLGKLSIGTFNGVPKRPPFFFEICNPGTPDDYPFYFWMWRNLDVLRREYVEKFSAPVDKLIGEIVEDPRVAPNTDLINLFSVLSSMFKYESASTPRIIYMFSDMRQHTEELSFYSNPPPKMDSFAELFGARTGGRMQGLKVAVFFLPVKGKPAETVVKEYWTKAFQKTQTQLIWHSL